MEFGFGRIVLQYKSDRHKFAAIDFFPLVSYPVPFLNARFFDNKKEAERYANMFKGELEIVFAHINVNIQDTNNGP